MILRYLLKNLVLPPLLPLWIGVLGYVLLSYRPQLARLLLVLSLASLGLLSLPITEQQLNRWSVHYPAVDYSQARNCDAMVVLGGGRYRQAPEFGYIDVLNPAAAMRVQYAAYLFKQRALPILVSGGRVWDEPQSEAELMAQALQTVYGIRVQWQEDLSRTTAENAQFSYDMLARQHKTNIVLVTHAEHMHRAVEVFRQQGFNVLPAPTQFASAALPWTDLRLYIPTLGSLAGTRRILHEWLGLWWYRWRASPSSEGQRGRLGCYRS